ncbi:MAG: response regulator, partial [Gemmatimonadetes bacterium]|nr:response regulator [Gemmatimonadota bacterium]
VVSAETGREAVERFDDGVYDVVLMDFHMPEMDGLEAARMIRAAEASRSVAPTLIIALTANAMASARDEALEAGMDGYLTKPLDETKLVETIQSLSRSRAMWPVR